MLWYLLLFFKGEELEKRVIPSTPRAKCLKPPGQLHRPAIQAHCKVSQRNRSEPWPYRGPGQILTVHSFGRWECRAQWFVLNNLMWSKSEKKPNVHSPRHPICSPRLLEWFAPLQARPGLHIYTSNKPWQATWHPLPHLWLWWKPHSDTMRHSQSPPPHGLGPACHAPGPSQTWFQCQPPRQPPPAPGWCGTCGTATALGKCIRGLWAGDGWCGKCNSMQQLTKPRMSRSTVLSAFQISAPCPSGPPGVSEGIWHRSGACYYPVASLYASLDHRQPGYHATTHAIAHTWLTVGLTRDPTRTVWLSAIQVRTELK